MTMDDLTLSVWQVAYIAWKAFPKSHALLFKFVFLNNFLDVMNSTNCIEKSRVDSERKTEVVWSNSADWIRSNRNIEN